MPPASSAKPALGEAALIVQTKRPNLKHGFEGNENSIRSLVFLHGSVYIMNDGTMRNWNCDTGPVVGESWKVRVEACGTDAVNNAMRVASWKGSVQQ
jgi:hypothetical protein